MVTKMKNFLRFKTGDKNPDLRKFGEEYYLREAKLWRPFRLFGIFSTVLSLAFTMAAIFNDDWIELHGHRAGMWGNCYNNLTSPTDCTPIKPNWQNAVIGMMIFSVSFGFVSAVLAILGVCTTPLPKKIYYFHSAGEIFFVCAFSSAMALIIYPVAIEVDHKIELHTYGTGYQLGWGGAAFFLAAAICMSLDELVRETTSMKCCRRCFKKKETERTELQQDSYRSRRQNSSRHRTKTNTELNDMTTDSHNGDCKILIILVPSQCCSDSLNIKLRMGLDISRVFPVPIVATKERYRIVNVKRCIFGAPMHHTHVLCMTNVSSSSTRSTWTTQLVTSLCDYAPHDIVHGYLTCAPGFGLYLDVACDSLPYIFGKIPLCPLQGFSRLQDVVAATTGSETTDIRRYREHSQSTCDLGTFKRHMRLGDILTARATGELSHGVDWGSFSWRRRLRRLSHEVDDLGTFSQDERLGDFLRT
ncbi:hypothetical protein ScPMuIL_008700 [Solemya velum]